MMKMIVSIPLTFFLLSGCSIRLRKATPSVKKTEAKPQKKAEVVPLKKADKKQVVEKTPVIPESPIAVWHLHTPALGLNLISPESGEKISVDLDTGYNLRKLPEGEWQVTSFTTGGTGYYATSSSAHVNFQISANAYVYVGSLFVQCPLCFQVPARKMRADRRK